MESQAKPADAAATATLPESLAPTVPTTKKKPSAVISLPQPISTPSMEQVITEKQSLPPLSEIRQASAVVPLPPISSFPRAPQPQPERRLSNTTIPFHQEHHQAQQYLSQSLGSHSRSPYQSQSPHFAQSYSHPMMHRSPKEVSQASFPSPSNFVQPHHPAQYSAPSPHYSPAPPMQHSMSRSLSASAGSPMSINNLISPSPPMSYPEPQQAYRQYDGISPDRPEESRVPY